MDVVRHQFAGCFSEGTGDFSLLEHSSPGGRLGGLRARQVEFTAIQQFPLHFFTCLQANGRGQGQREIDIETRLLAFGTDGLDF